MKIRDNPEGSAGQETQDSFIFFFFFFFLAYFTIFPDNTRPHIVCCV